MEAEKEGHCGKKEQNVELSVVIRGPPELWGR